MSMNEILLSLAAGMVLGLIIPVSLRLPSLRLSHRRRARRAIPSCRLQLSTLDRERAEAAHDAIERPRQAGALHALHQIRSMSSPTLPLVLGTLRKINPYVFEELVLLCLAERGFETWARDAYSNDGGVDGWAVIRDRAVVVQAKRWQGHVRHRDIRALSGVAAAAAGVGLFVHTGRTGRMSRVTARRYGVNILSGRQLYDLVVGNPLDLHWYEPEVPRELDVPLPASLPLYPAGARVLPALCH